MTSRFDSVKAPKPTEEAPSMDEIQDMVFDGDCTATDGCRCDPDGHCEHGHESWLLHFGLI
jgi:hypothetical protein